MKNIDLLTADLASRVNSMKTDCATNNAELFKRLIEEHEGRYPKDEDEIDWMEFFKVLLIITVSVGTAAVFIALAISFIVSILK